MKLQKKVRTRMRKRSVRRRTIRRIRGGAPSSINSLSSITDARQNRPLTPVEKTHIADLIATLKTADKSFEITGYGGHASAVPLNAYNFETNHLMVPWKSIDTNTEHNMMLYIKPVLLNPTNHTNHSFINTVNIHFYSTLNKQVNVNKTLELNSGTTIAFVVPYTDLISQTNKLHAKIYFESTTNPNTVFTTVPSLFSKGDVPRDKIDQIVELIENFIKGKLISINNYVGESTNVSKMTAFYKIKMFPLKINLENSTISTKNITMYISGKPMTKMIMFDCIIMYPIVVNTMLQLKANTVIRIFMPFEFLSSTNNISKLDLTRLIASIMVDTDQSVFEPIPATPTPNSEAAYQSVFKNPVSKHNNTYYREPNNSMATRYERGELGGY